MEQTFWTIILYVVGIIIYGNIGFIFFKLCNKKQGESKMADFFIYPAGGFWEMEDDNDFWYGILWPFGILIALITWLAWLIGGGLVKFFLKTRKKSQEKIVHDGP